MKFLESLYEWAGIDLIPDLDKILDWHFDEDTKYKEGK